MGYGIWDGAFHLPSSGMIAFEPADAQFDGQQHAQDVTCAVHGPDGPRLGGAEGPGTKQRHHINDRLSQVVADSIKLHVVSAQRAISVYWRRLAVWRRGYKLNEGAKREAQGGKRKAQGAGRGGPRRL